MLHLILTAALALLMVTGLVGLIVGAFWILAEKLPEIDTRQALRRRERDQ